MIKDTLCPDAWLVDLKTNNQTQVLYMKRLRMQHQFVLLGNDDRCKKRTCKRSNTANASYEPQFNPTAARDYLIKGLRSHNPQDIHLLSWSPNEVGRRDLSLENPSVLSVGEGELRPLEAQQMHNKICQTSPSECSFHLRYSMRYTTCTCNYHTNLLFTDKRDIHSKPQARQFCRLFPLGLLCSADSHLIGGAGTMP